MSDSEQDLAVLDVDALLVTHELARRPARAPDHAAENHALGALARILARRPENVPQRLAELLRELCRTGSAGIAVPSQDGAAFCWSAASGVLADAAGLHLPRAGSPSGQAVARGEVVLLRAPGRSFPVLPAGPPIEEMLLAPWDVGGEPLGTVWVASHGPDCRFDAEDVRLLRSLSSFAACAHRATRSSGRSEEARRSAGHEILQRADELQEVQRRLADESAQRLAAERQLQESDGCFRVLAEASPALIYQFNDRGQVVYANRACQDRLGMRSGSVPEDAWDVQMDPEEGSRYVERVRCAIATRTPFQQRMRARAADGRRHWFESYGAPLLGHGGDYRGHVGIAIDVTEAVEAEDALREADRRKDEFLATLAHELRNPLAPISNAVHLLRRPDGRRSADRMVKMVGRQVRQIVRLVDDLMDVSRITQGKLELRREELPLAEVLSMAVETSMPAIEAGRHELAVSLPEETLMLDATRPG